MASDNGLAEDELEIEIRPPREVGERLILLSAVCHRLGLQRADAETDDEDAEDEDSLEGDRFDWVQWLTEHGLSEGFTPAEAALFEEDGDELDEDEVDALVGSATGLRALAWAANLAGPGGTGQADLVRLLETIPSPWDDPRPFLSATRLRPESDLVVAREVAELTLWRASVEMERRRARGAALKELEEAISDVTIEAGAAGLLEIGDDGDVLIGAVPIRRLSEERLEDLVVLNRERLRAFSWLCGLAEWDDELLIEL
jgi:hypothetical protein